MQSSDAVIKLLKAAVIDTAVHDNVHMLGNRIEEYGFTKLGNGAYSVVVEHPFRDDVVLKIGTDKNDGWLRYAVYVMLHPDPVFLTVHNLHMFDRFYIAEIERLSPNYDYSRLKDVGGFHCNSAELDTPATKLIQDVLGRFTDLHQGNIMLRDGKPVITDPYSRCPHQDELYNPRTYAEVAGTKIIVTQERFENERQARARMAEDSTKSTARAEAQDYALRDKPKPIGASDFARLAGILPQMQPDVLRGAYRAAQFGRFEAARPNFDHGPAPALRLQAGVWGRERGKSVFPAMALAGVDYAAAERAILHRMDPKVLAVCNADIYGRGFAIRDSFVPQSAPRRHKAEVFNANFFGRHMRIPVKDREHREELDRLQRDLTWCFRNPSDYRRHIKRDTGRDIPTEWIAAWNVAWGGQAGPLVGPRCQHYWNNRYLDGPRQGRQAGNNAGRTEAYAYGRKAQENCEQQRPEAAFG